MSSWLKAVYWGSTSYSNMDQTEYFTDYAKHIAKLITRPGTKVDVAVLKEDQNEVLSYIVYNDQVLYFAYTKRDFRKAGMLNTLLKDMDFTHVHVLTKIGKVIADKKELKYN